MFIFFQKILPKHLLSRCLGFFAHCRCAFFKNAAIRFFIRYFKVDMSESLITDIKQFPSFNDFFIRQLKPDVRPVATDPAAIICPVDGVISELGKIHVGRLLQAKGVEYELVELLGGDAALAQHFVGGDFFTAYLAPKDYHRVHMPVAGRLRQMTYVPGQLFSVNPTSVLGIPRLFARNERVICEFDTTIGPMAVIFVGALLIGGVATAWHGQVMPASSNEARVRTYSESAIFLHRGDEIGYFQWGSTVILLFGQNYLEWQGQLHAGNSVQMGQLIGIKHKKHDEACSHELAGQQLN